MNKKFMYKKFRCTWCFKEKPCQSNCNNMKREDIKKDWSEVEACIYESKVDYKMYFKLYNDDNRAIREIKNTKALDLPIVNIDYDVDGNIIGIEVIGSK